MGQFELFGIDVSPPVRTCHLALKALKLPYDYKVIDVLGGETRTKEYLAKNPRHTVPTFRDEDVYISDSHAIVAYLVNKYSGNDDSLYPKDPYQRAIVDQRLHYDSSVAFQVLRNTMLPVYFKNQPVVPRERIDEMIAVYDLIELFLKDHDYIAGDHLTIADFSLVATITSLDLIWPIDAKKYAKITAWIKRQEALPYYAEGNAKGVKEYKELMKAKNLSVAP